MKRLIAAFLLVASVAWAGGPDVQAPSAEDINTSISSVTTTLATKANLSGSTSQAFSTSTLSASGFSSFGEASTGLKCKYLVATMPASVGQTVTVAHGVGSNLVSFTTYCNWTTTAWCPPDFGTTRNFSAYHDGTNINISIDGSATELTGKPVRILLWYIQ